MNAQRSWQLKLFNRTLKKKEKLGIIRKYLPDLTNARCLDLGCAKGTISYFLRQDGGFWIHEDLDFENVMQTRLLTGPYTVVISSHDLPHSNNAFDLIVSLDILEHIRDDSQFLREMVRVLKPGGILILSTPASGPVFLLNRLKNRVGLTPDQYGHVVEGYTLEDLTKMLKSAGMDVQTATTYSRFFTELIELMINIVFVKFLRKKQKEKRDGHISPGSAEEIAKYKKQLSFYSLIYPIVYLITRLDYLLFWQKGYATLIRAIKK
jgi:2-polyprenyl-3-methyl-5-hydroxy-6-metoxy-1,4-benzoquinol methylase